MKKMYQNPIARNGDFADPFIIKYNGIFYLYATNPDVKCWSSPDLLKWKEEGTVIRSEVFSELVPFAPEVIYWNGHFYMYTSPSGFGHYVLRSNSPTGPFEKITDNIGHNIDGSVFIDDDDQWYFYWADDHGIKGCKMKNPYTLGREYLTEAFMDGWTEGSYIIKRNGQYYMTYTGNHYLSKGYRINSAVSNHPLKGYVPDEGNPILVNTEEDGVGLGHSCTVIGPDLKTYYLIYHNLNPDASRDLNIDTIGWVGDRMIVFGPTTGKMPAPTLPLYFDYCNHKDSFENWEVLQGNIQIKDDFLCTDNSTHTSIIFKDKIDREYTAELNLKLNSKTIEGESFGAYFSYINNNTYGKITINPYKKIAYVSLIIQGEIIEDLESELAEDYDATSLHTLRIEVTSESYNIYFDQRLKFQGQTHGRLFGAVGYWSDTEVAIGYTALNQGIVGDNGFDDPKPVPGIVYGVHEKLSDLSVQRKSKSQSVSVDCKNQEHIYQIQVLETGSYNMQITIGNYKKGTFLVEMDGILWEKVELIEKDDNLKIISVKDRMLTEGEHLLRFRWQSGCQELIKMEFYKGGKQLKQIKKFISDEIGFVSMDSYGKRLYGEKGWDDYIVNGLIRCEDGVNAGLIFRVTNAAEGGEGDDPYLGRNFFQGYYVGLEEGGVTLYRQSYDKKDLACCTGKYTHGKVYPIKVHARKNHIKVYVENMDIPKLEFVDSQPFTHGRIGVKTDGSKATFTSLECELL